MQISIHYSQDHKGRPSLNVFVEGSSKNSPKQVAKAYLDTFKELNKDKEEK